MALYKLIWGSAVSACSQRQPFIELAKDQGNGAPAKNSILLDYRSYSTFLSWFIAFQNGHYLIGISILFSLILSIFVVPLSAYLFTPGTIISSTTVQLNMTTSFNESAITSHTDLGPVFEAASATSIYNGYPQPWTNRNYSFQAFSAPNDIPTAANLSVDTIARSASLDCSIIPQSQYSADFTQSQPDKGSLVFSADDRGCVISRNLTVSNITEFYFRTWSTSHCSNSARYSRFSLILGRLSTESPSWLSNFSAISCIPSYWTAPGQLKLKMPLNSVIDYSFSPDPSAPPTEIRPYLWRIFEGALHFRETFDPTGTSSTTDIGRLIFDCAKVASPDWPLKPLTAFNCTSLLFASIYATLAGQVLFQKAEAPLQATYGTLSTPTLRLLVYPPIAYTIVAVLCAVLGITVYILIYSETHVSILLEDPDNLVSVAGLLHQSGINTLVERARNPEKYGKFTGQTMQKIEEHKLLQNATCKVEDWGDPENSRIVIIYQDGTREDGLVSRS